MEFQARDVLRVTGLSYRQLDHCLRSGLMGFAGRSCGRGRRRRFGVYDLIALTLLRNVLQAGVPAQAVAPALRLVQSGQSLPTLDRLHDTAVWTDGDVAVLTQTGERSPRSSEVISYVLDLGCAAAHVAFAIRELSRTTAR
jgi:DNA-binding transcriptional MerR regulator